MKKLLIFAFAIMFSFTNAFAGDNNDTGDSTDDQDHDTPDLIDGGSLGSIIVITFRGWCKKATIRKTFDHEPSYLETLGPKMEANRWCDIANGGPFSLIGID